MKLKKLGVIGLLVFIGISVSGCIEVNSDFGNIRNSLLKNMNGRFERDIEFSVGSLGIKIAKSFVKFADTEEDIDGMLNQVSHVQIGVYSIKEHNRFQPSMLGLKQLCMELQKDGWQYIVKNINDDEITTVFLNRNNDGQLNRLLVVNYSDDELVLAELTGNLEKLIQHAIKDNGIKFKISDNY